MITEEATLLLKSLQAEVCELKRSVEELRALILSEKPEMADNSQRAMSFEEAAGHVRSDYSHLLHKLSQ
jgi:hypothetical protein